MRRRALAALALAAALRAADPWPDPGLPGTRDLFPLNLVPLAYVPRRAEILPAGALRMAVQVARSNTFEFSPDIKDALAHAPDGRLRVDLAAAREFAAAHADRPLAYYFDAEVERTSVTLTAGLGHATDVSLQAAWTGLGGGWLDGVIETVHRLGFGQTGRDRVRKDQLDLVVIQRGQVTVFDQRPTRAQVEDPVLTLRRRLAEGPTWSLAASVDLKLPATRWHGLYRSGWDSGAALLAQVRPGPGQRLEAGVAYLRRSLASGGPSPFFVHDQAAWHLAWEGRFEGPVRPFLVLVGTRSLGRAGQPTAMDRSTLVHDLGVHCRIGPRTVATLSYVNNISHNENTADMGLALRLAFQLAAPAQG